MLTTICTTENRGRPPPRDNFRVGRHPGGAIMINCEQARRQTPGNQAERILSSRRIHAAEFMCVR